MHKLYQLYHTNINLEVFLNTFLKLFKMAKIDDFQVLDMLYKKLSDEFKNRLVIIRKRENLNNLILLLCNIDTNMKKISKQSQFRIKPNASNVSTIKHPFKSYNLTSTNPSTTIRVTVVSPVSSTAIGTHLIPMDMSNTIKHGLIIGNLFCPNQVDLGGLDL